MSLHPSVRATAQHVAAIAFGVVLIDGVSKASASYLASLNYANGIIIPVQNPDFSLGVATAALPIVLVLASLGIIAFGGYTAREATLGTVPIWVPGLLIGGALGNLADRLLFGAVHDWLNLGKVVINFADLAVLVGILGYGGSLAFAYRRRL
jgi:lipoprotein signal peptidase